MQHNWFDAKSFVGAFCSLMLVWMGKIFAWMGITSLQDLAIVFAIGASATTVIYNVIKTVKEIKNKKG